MDDQLADVLRRLRARPLDAPAGEPFFVPDSRDEDYEPDVPRVGHDYELLPEEWRPIPVEGECPHRPHRFIDGAFQAQVVASIEDSMGRQRPLVLATLGAVALDLRPSPISRRFVLGRAHHDVRVQLAVLPGGLNPRDIEILRGALVTVGIDLLAPSGERLPSDFDDARLRTIEQVRQSMLALESGLLRREPDVPTVIDGLLDHRLETFPTRNLPVVGVVKRQMRTYLRRADVNLMYRLQPGERTPAVLLDTTRGEFVTFYLRLASAPDSLPGAGVVRVMVSRAFYEESVGADSRYLTGLAAWLCRLRCRDASYARALVSLEPIVHAEQHIRALLPNLGERIGAFHRVTGLRTRAATPVSV